MSANQKKPRTKRRPTLDWEAIDREILANQFSLREIAQRFGCTDTAIRKHMKAKGIKRDLSEAVRQRTRAKLVRVSVRDQHANEDQIVETAANQNIALVEIHRKDIKAGRELVCLLYGQLKEAADNREVLEDLIHDETKGKDGERTDYKRRSAMLRAVALPAHAGVLRDLSGALKNLIPLERQAYGIDEDGRRPDPVEEISIQLVSADKDE
jgi:predicted DNA-binding protein YlxM (UPF0122 family)